MLLDRSCSRARARNHRTTLHCSRQIYVCRVTGIPFRRRLGAHVLALGSDGNLFRHPNIFFFFKFDDLAPFAGSAQLCAHLASRLGSILISVGGTARVDRFTRSDYLTEASLHLENVITRQTARRRPWRLQQCRSWEQCCRSCRCADCATSGREQPRCD